MLYSSRIEVSEGVDVNKTSASKKCINCHYWCFSSKGFKFQLSARNRCHDVFMMLMNLNDITTLNIHGVDYQCIFNGISKCEAINVLKKY